MENPLSYLLGGVRSNVSDARLEYSRKNQARVREVLEEKAKQRSKSAYNDANFADDLKKASKQ